MTIATGIQLAVTTHEDRKRVLVVDDRSFIPGAIQRGLADQRDRWDIAFASSAAQALEHMSICSTDIVITDVAMRHADGVRLLAEVRRRFPGVVRVLLTGTLDQAYAVQGLAIAHFAMGKPWRWDTFANVLDAASAMHSLVRIPALRTIVAAMKDMPAPPPAYADLCAVLDQPHASAGEVERALSEHRFVADSVLDLANTGLVAEAPVMGTITEAVRLLGASTFRNLVLAVDVFSMFGHLTARGAFSQEFRNALLCATVAGTIAPHDLSHEAFAAGLLHDIGKHLLAVRLPTTYRETMTHALGPDQDHEQSHASNLAAERQVLGVTHAEIGAFLLGTWGFPRSVIEAVAYHHEPSCQGRYVFDALAAVYLANLLVSESTRTDIDHDYLSSLGITYKLGLWRECVHALRARFARQALAAPPAMPAGPTAST